MRHLLIASFFTLTLLNARAQELNCQVQVIHQQIQGIDRTVFQEIETFIFEFMNGRRWTSETFGVEERISCQLVLTISDANLANNSYSGDLQVISSRPVYNTAYQSPVINLKDERVAFTFLRNMQIDFNPDQYTNNLLSILAYYAYIIIAYDYDTFSPEGGTPYFNIAQRIVQAAQGSPAQGWKAFENERNRHWIVANILHSTFRPMRTMLYRYHRLGMDNLSTNLEESRATIASSLKLLNSIHQIKPLAYNTQIFFLAKRDEIINLFTPAPQPERTEVHALVTKVDPGNISNYERILKGK